MEVEDDKGMVKDVLGNEMGDVMQSNEEKYPWIIHNVGHCQIGDSEIHPLEDL